jgi:hypothetical protein
LLSKPNDYAFIKSIFVASENIWGTRGMTNIFKAQIQEKVEYYWWQKDLNIRPFESIQWQYIVNVDITQ